MMRLLALLALASAPALSQTVVIYSRLDAEAAQQARALADIYEPAFIDRALPAGVPWRAAIAAELCGAKVVLLVWSAHAAASDQVRREIDTALWCHAPIVPVLLDSTPLPGVVADINALDWRSRK